MADNRHRHCWRCRVTAPICCSTVDEMVVSEMLLGAVMQLSHGTANVMFMASKALHVVDHRSPIAYVA